MKKICALLIICSIGLFNVGCDKKKDAGAGGTSTSATPAGTGTSTTPSK